MYVLAPPRDNREAEREKIPANKFSKCFFFHGRICKMPLTRKLRLKIKSNFAVFLFCFINTMTIYNWYPYINHENIPDRLIHCMNVRSFNYVQDKLLAYIMGD